MVDVNKLIYWLNRICKELDDEYCINEGGCCYVAYVIAKFLKKYNIEYYLSILNYEPKDPDMIIKNIQKRVKKAGEDQLIIKNGTCNHYFITIDDKKVNGCGYYWRSPKLFRMNISINPENILWIYHNGDWCSTYDKRNNLVVYNQIENIFKKCQKK